MYNQMFTYVEEYVVSSFKLCLSQLGFQKRFHIKRKSSIIQGMLILVFIK